MHVDDVLFLVPLCFFAKICDCYQNNVCKTLSDYSNKTVNPNCWYNPDLDSTPEEIAHRYGFNLQRNIIVTADGYHLTLFHLTDRNHPNNIIEKEPVFIQHGLASNGMAFITAGTRSLGFYLGRRGYDVWIGNARGSQYSLGHEKYSISSKKYWDFSFHEMALYDLPAVMEYITKVNGQYKKIIYFGHSMGTTMLTIYASVMKEHANKFIRMAILLCPVAFTTQPPPYAIMAPAVQNLLNNLISSGRHVAFAPTSLEKKLQMDMCNSYPQIRVCEQILFTLQGFSEEIMPEDLPMLLKIHPSMVSLKSLTHFIQRVYHGGKFIWYDYGRTRNVWLYGTKVPRIYDLTEIEIPVHLIHAVDDLFTSEQDVKLLFNILRMKTKTMYRIIRFNHMDVLYGKNVETKMYKHILNLLSTSI